MVFEEYLMTIYGKDSNFNFKIIHPWRKICHCDASIVKLLNFMIGNVKFASDYDVTCSFERDYCNTRIIFSKSIER